MFAPNAAAPTTQATGFRQRAAILPSSLTFKTSVLLQFPAINDRENDIAKIVEEGECYSKGTVSITTQDDLKGVTPKALDVAPLAIREEGECTPSSTLPHSSTKEDEIGVVPVDSDSSLSNANQLAVRAKDSLEKKVKGRNGKHKKGSAKKGRKRQSPPGGNWR